MNRSPLTVLHTVRKHDENMARPRSLPGRGGVSDIERTKILRGVRRGVSISTLADADVPHEAGDLSRRHRRAHRSMTSAKCASSTIPLYHTARLRIGRQRNRVAEQLPASAEGGRAAYPGVNLPAYLPHLYRTPLLLASARARSVPEIQLPQVPVCSGPAESSAAVRPRAQLAAMESVKAIDTKNDIIRANLRLVVSVARKHLRPGRNMMELISDGNITLMRAVEASHPTRLSLQHLCDVGPHERLRTAACRSGGPVSPDRPERSRTTRLLAELPEVHPESAPPMR